MNPLQLACKSCGKPIPAEDVNIDKAIAKCRACEAVFSLGDDIGSTKPQAVATRGIEVDDWGPELRITWHWFTQLHWLPVFVVLGWNGFVVLWFFNTIARLTGLLPGSDKPNAETAEAVSLLVGVPMAIWGAAMAYGLLCRCINKTVIIVSQDELLVRQGPLTFGLAQPVVRVNELGQLYCTKTQSRGDSCYDVMAALSSGATMCLVAGLKELDQALFIKQAIEQRLRIGDEEVPEEVRV